MKKKNIKDFVDFGRSINYLRFIQVDALNNGRSMVKYALETSITSVDELDLIVTANLRGFLALREYKEKFDEKNSDYLVSNEDIQEISSLMHHIKEVIDAELQGKNVFVITEKRMKVPKLLDDIKKLFATDVFINLPDLPRFDFTESGKCIAFERPTAGAFHILRGMEGIMRWLHDKLTNSSGCSYNWGPIINNLKKLSNPPPNEILDQSDAIRLNYRNPTAHPELTYTIDDIQDLLSECIAVVNRIVHHLIDYNML